MEKSKNIFSKTAVFLGLWLLTLFLNGCGDNAETSAEPEKRPESVKYVKVSPVKALPPRGTVEYVGVLLAHRKVNVASEIGGTIEKLYFEKGEKAQKGKLLAEVSTTSIGLEVRRAKAALEEAKAALSEAESNFRRIKGLHEIDAVADSEYDYAKRSAHMARANVEKAEAALALSRDQLKKSTLLAPIDGIIAFRDVEEGEVISPGTTITRIVNLERLKIKLSVGEKDIHILEKHRGFTFTLEAIPGEAFSCQVSFISPTADPATRSFPVEMTVTTPDRRMADGMTVKVKLPLLSTKKTIKVHSAWLTEEDGNIGLYVVKDGTAFFTQVTLGAYYDQRVEILSGLSDQQLVIINPAGLKSGDVVKY